MYLSELGRFIVRLAAIGSVTVAIATLLMFLGAGLLSTMRSPRARAAGMAVLHTTHFDRDVRPSRSVRRAIHKGLKFLWLTRDDTSTATGGEFKGLKVVMQNGVKGFFMGDRFCPLIAGGAPGAELLEKDELKKEDLASVSTETLYDLRTDVVGRSEELMKKATEAGGFHTLEKPERDNLRSGVDKLKLLTEVIAEREGDQEMLTNIAKAKDADEARKNALRTQQRPEIYGPNGELQVVEFTTPGERFVDSDQYKDFLKRGAKGDSEVMAWEDASKLMGLRTGTDKLKARALITGADTSAGTMVRPQFLGLQEPGLVRPLTLRDFVTVLPTESDAIEYVREDTRASNAAPTAEATQIADVGDETATKPEGGLTFTVVTDTVKIIAEWVAVTTKILADAPQLRAYIDEYLLYDLALELEDQMIAGSGTGENFRGILNTVGIQTLAAPVGPATSLDNLRKAKTLVFKNGRTRANAVALSPEDSQNLDLQKVNAESNHFAGSGPFAYQENQPIWGLPRVECEGIPAGHAVVGDFRRAVLYDREQAQISVGTVGDDFIRNIRRVLAEGRWGFGVRRPKAFVDVTL